MTEQQRGSDAQGVAVGMSGGVDSAVTAHLLQREGWNVQGVTLRFVDSPEQRKAERDAAAVCRNLGIPHHVHDACAPFELRVVSPFVEDYAAGRTPSPCVGCNATCKFPSLARAADKLGCAKIATGHYASVETYAPTGRLAVRKACDQSKDQSYMLALLPQALLARTLLPLGALSKPEVRAIASDLGLSVAEKPESQDNCFAGENYREFLAARGVREEPGDIVDTEGRVLGRHSGLSAYTLGQRKGLGVAAGQPLYVIGKDAARNELRVGFADEAHLRSVRVGPMTWQAVEDVDAPIEAAMKLRYRSAAVPCIIRPDINEDVVMEFAYPQSLTAPGQYAVAYEGDIVLGAGPIKEVRR